MKRQQGFVMSEYDQNFNIKTELEEDCEGWRGVSFLGDCGTNTKSEPVPSSLSKREEHLKGELIGLGNGVPATKVKEEDEFPKEEFQNISRIKIEHHEDLAGDQHAYQDLQCGNSLLVVVKTEPEEINVSVRSGLDQHILQGNGDGNNTFSTPQSKKEWGYNSKNEQNNEADVKTEPEEQKVKCESESEIPHVLYLAPECKTETNTKEISYPIYRSNDQQIQTQLWSDCEHIPEMKTENKDVNTNNSSETPSTNRNTFSSALKKKNSGEGKHGKCRTASSRSPKTSKKQKMPRSYSCPECGKTFFKSSCFHEHMRVHRRKRAFQCSYCGKSFTHSKALTNHERTHTGEKPYQCFQCAKFFTRIDALQIHQRTHTGEKPYNCSQCGKAFTRSDVYRNHYRIHTGEKPYKCPQCAKAFTRLDSYQNHQRIHTGEKPYHCSVCGKHFLYLSNLNNHQRTHTKERPYHCSLCDKTFIQSGHLTKHLKAHSQEKS